MIISIEKINDLENQTASVAFNRVGRHAYFAIREGLTVRNPIKTTEEVVISSSVDANCGTYKTTNFTGVVRFMGLDRVVKGYSENGDFSGIIGWYEE